MNSVMKTVIFWTVIVVSAFLLWQTVKSGGSAQTVPKISYSEFMTRIASGRVSKVKVTGSVVRGSDAKSGGFLAIVPFPDAGSARRSSAARGGNLVRGNLRTELAALDTELRSPCFVGRPMAFHDPPDAETASVGRWTRELYASAGIEPPFWRVTSVPCLYRFVFCRKGLKWGSALFPVEFPPPASKLMMLKRWRVSLAGMGLRFEEF